MGNDTQADAAPPEAEELRERLREADKDKQDRLASWLEESKRPEDAALEAYRYESLPSSHTQTFRLLHLLPGAEWDQIHLELEIADVVDSTYEALSYTWGDPTVLSTIICNGKRLRVTRNLKKALRELRQQHDVRTIWIDAVCIDQGNVDERTHQVGIMRDIYVNAHQTIIWLCEDYFEVDLAFAALARMHEGIYKNIITGQVDFSAMMRAARPDLDEKKISLKPSEDEKMAMYTIMKKPWFERIWVVQEVALSKSPIVKCGVSEMHWQAFSGGYLSWLFLSFWDKDLTSSVTQHLLSIWQTREAKIRADAGTGDISDLTLMSLLQTFRESRATDPRDKAYAMYGLTTTNLQSLNLIPDYKLGVEQVYTDVAKALLSESGSLDILSVWKVDTPLARRLPSWVPDWSDTAYKPGALIEAPADGANPERAFVPYAATASSRTIVPAFNGEGRRLKLQGACIDAIRELGDPLTAEGVEVGDVKMISTDMPFSSLMEKMGVFSHLVSGYYDCIARYTIWMHIYRQWIEMVIGRKRQHAKEIYRATGESREEVLMRTLTLNWSRFGEEQTREHYREWLDKVLTQSPTWNPLIRRVPGVYKMMSAVTTVRTADKSTQDFEIAIRSKMLRKICWTKTGYLCMVPDSARKGDELWLLNGCRVPMVLRPKPKLSGYELIGESYVHGAMYGELYKAESSVEVTLV